MRTLRIVFSKQPTDFPVQSGFEAAAAYAAGRNLTYSNMGTLHYLHEILQLEKLKLASCQKQTGVGNNAFEILHLMNCA
jgi:hypothetical protein